MELMNGESFFLLRELTIISSTIYIVNMFFHQKINQVESFRWHIKLS